VGYTGSSSSQNGDVIVMSESIVCSNKKCSGGMLPVNQTVLCKIKPTKVLQCPKCYKRVFIFTAESVSPTLDSGSLFPEPVPFQIWSHELDGDGNVSNYVQKRLDEKGLRIRA
jgi:hypothetical protein